MLLDPHVRSKLDVEFGDEGPKLVIKGDNGQPVDMTVEDFEKSVVDNPAYKSIIVESRASGGGAADEQSGDRKGGAFPAANNGGSKSLADMDPAELAASLSKNR